MLFQDVAHRSDADFDEAAELLEGNAVCKEVGEVLVQNFEDGLRRLIPWPGVGL